MSYDLEFLRDAWKEWEKLDESLKAQFKKKLSERLENPRVESARLRQLADCYRIKLPAQAIDWSIKSKIPAWVVSVVAVGKRDRSLVYEAAGHRLA